MLRQLPNPETLKGKRDRAILAVLLGCGLRRRELTALTIQHFQRREDHWAIVDLIGKGGHVRTVPSWVKKTIDDWSETKGSFSIRQAVANRIPHEVGSLMYPKGFHDVAAVSGNGVETEAQVVRDLPI
jgi:site-specific recombinase XerC